jgi:hypothetical protein
VRNRHKGNAEGYPKAQRHKVFRDRKKMAEKAAKKVDVTNFSFWRNTQQEWS